MATLPCPSRSRRDRRGWRPWRTRPRRKAPAWAASVAPAEGYGVLLRSGGLRFRGHFTETAGADVENEPPDRDVLRDPRVRSGPLHLLPGVVLDVGEAVEP